MIGRDAPTLFTSERIPDEIVDVIAVQHHLLSETAAVRRLFPDLPPS